MVFSKYRSFVVFFILWSCFAWADSSLVLKFNGHISAEKLAEAGNRIREIKNPSEVTVLLDSSSGDLESVVKFGKILSDLKKNGSLKIVVYIENNAVGPAAVFPFLADEIYVGSFALWGDVSLGTDGIIPVNILKSTITSLIAPNMPKRDLFNLLATAMCDPERIVVYDGSLHLVSNPGEFSDKIISDKGENLILNRNQMLSLGIAKEGTPPALSEQIPEESGRSNEVKEKESQTVEKALAVQSINQSDFDNFIHSGITVIDFYADWCGPCKKLVPVYRELAHDFEGKVKFGKINIDYARTLIDKKNVKKIPTIILFKDGQEIKRRGQGTKSELEEWINSAITE